MTTKQHRYISDTLRVATRSNPDRGGKKVESRTFKRNTTVVLPGGLVREDTREYWKDIGTVMDTIENHVPEQPASYAKKLLQAHLDAQRNTA